MKLTCCLVVIHVDPLQLQVAVPVVSPGRVDAMFVTYHLPELDSEKEKDNGSISWLTSMTYPCECIISFAAK